MKQLFPHRVLVALMDSFDSTMGTKQGSQEPRQEDMQPIPEDQEHDELDGAYRPVGDSNAMTTSEPTTKGLVKTGTGNSSHIIMPQWG